MTLRLEAVALEVREPDEVATFWAGVLDRDIVRESDSALLPGDDTQIGLRFVTTDKEKSGPNSTHLHLTSSTIEAQMHTVERAVGLGARHIDLGQVPEDGHIVLADPNGNEFCVIEPENGFLAGCGVLGEATCEGSPVAGRFWHQALDWPLVWDRGQQTAIQSPMGGTKVSWDVRPGPPAYGNWRQRLDLTSTELAMDVDRLLSLGATKLRDQDGRRLLADPDGTEFSVRHIS